MSLYTFFAALQVDKEKLASSMPGFGLLVMGSLVVFTIGYLLWLVFVPVIQERWKERGEKAEADRNIEFDLKESSIRRGHRSLKVPENSLEYFVCKLVFEELDEPQLDLNVLEAAGKDAFDQRAVYQAVRRLNGKAKIELELKADLLNRRKEKTLLNNIERLI